MDDQNQQQPGVGQPVVPPVQAPVEPSVPAEETPAVPPAPEPQAPGAGEPAPMPEQPANPGQWTPPQGGDQGNGGTPAA